MFLRYLRPGVTLTLAMTLTTGVLYPLLITGLSRIAFPLQAGGSIVQRDSASIGSSLIGQNFTSPRYFWGRPSATAPQPNNGTASGGSNLGPLNPALIDKIKANVKALRDADPTATGPIPVDLVTASASGFDPEISLQGAYFQLSRVARERKLAPAQIRAVIDAHQKLPVLGAIGEARVNVLELNLALDGR